MATNGRLGKGVISANTEVTMATLDSNISYASVQIIIANRSSTDTAKVKLLVCEGTSTSTDADVIDPGTELPPNSVYMNNVVLASAGESFRVHSDKGNLTYRIAGISK